MPAAGGRWSMLVSPLDGTPLRQLDDDHLVDGSGHQFPVVGGIPRFVEQGHYSGSFGIQWNLFPRTQLDRYNGTTISRDRFFRSTRWPPDTMRGLSVLEAGCGAGRFTAVALESGAEVYSVDASSAVDANLRNNGAHPHLVLSQAAIGALPFPAGCFDRIFCFGVLQHTVDPRATFLSLLPHLRPGGEIAVDIYARDWKWILRSKYWFRPFTTRMNQDTLLRLLRRMALRWLPVASALRRVPLVGGFLSQLIPIPDYSQQFPMLSKGELIEWAVMDSFDMLTPRYDRPERLSTLVQWFADGNLDLLHAGRGDNGYVAVGRKR